MFELGDNWIFQEEKHGSRIGFVYRKQIFQGNHRLTIREVLLFADTLYLGHQYFPAELSPECVSEMDLNCHEAYPSSSAMLKLYQAVGLDVPVTYHMGWRG